MRNYYVNFVEDVLGSGVKDYYVDGSDTLVSISNGITIDFNHFSIDMLLDSEDKFREYFKDYLVEYPGVFLGEMYDDYGDLSISLYALIDGDKLKFHILEIDEILYSFDDFIESLEKFISETYGG